MPATQQRVAVVGGGPAALVAAWEIVSRDPTAHVTVYQMGWRLGGKLATGRNPDVARRIEEHGIHVLFGAYENTFHVLRGAHEQLGSDWKAAFSEHGHATLMEEIDGEWRPWSIDFPRMPGEPGDGLANGLSGDPTLVEQARKLLLWLRDWVLGEVSDPLTGFFVGRAFDAAVDTLDGMPSPPLSPDVATIESLLGRALELLKLARTVGGGLFFVGGLLGIDTGTWQDRLRRLWVIADLASAVVVGLLRAVENGQSAKDIDETELRQWLSDNAPLGSLSQEALDSAPLKMVYEVVFAYEEGEADAPALAAGTSVRALLRLLFDYRGAFVYRMKQGSETVVNALYQALLACNTPTQTRVEFRFFHRLDGIELSSDRSQVEALTFLRQATPIGSYQPLDADGGWPDRPHFDQLQEGAQLRAASELASEGFDLEALETASPVGSTVAVQRRTDPSAADGFDSVVLGVSIGGLLGSQITRELQGLDETQPTAAQQRFRAMLEGQSVVATQSAQLWLSEPATGMGWSRADDLVGTFAQPFGNWADLSLTIPHESWSGGTLPRHAAYLAGPLPVADTPGTYTPEVWRAEVADRVRGWLETRAVALWPEAYDEAGFRWGWLIDPGGGVGPARLAAQWFRANRNAGELYTLTLPGSTKHRLGPESGFANLVLTGDWTDNTFNVGAVESAAMSGRQAARALLGVSFTVYGEA